MRKSFIDLIDSVENEVDNVKSQVENALDYLEDEAYEECLDELRSALVDLKSLSETLY